MDECKWKHVKYEEEVKKIPPGASGYFAPYDYWFCNTHRRQYTEDDPPPNGYCSMKAEEERKLAIRQKWSRRWWLLRPLPRRLWKPLLGREHEDCFEDDY